MGHFSQPFHSMALPRHLDRHLQDSKNFRDFCGQISPELGFNSSTSLHDQSQHPPFHVAGFAPVVQFDGVEWNSFGRKRVKEMDFLENNSQISSIDFWQGRSVSTGLGLSLDSPPIGSALLPLVGDDVERELQRQDAEIDRFSRFSFLGYQLRHAVLDKIQRSQYKTVALMEERVVQKLREKDEELEMVNRTNKELEVRIEQLAMEAEAWQQRAKYNENMVAALNYNLERAHGRPRDSIEGCGDSEVDDTASCFNRRNGECERNLSSCPLCQSSKFLGMEVYMITGCPQQNNSAQRDHETPVRSEPFSTSTKTRSTSWFLVRWGCRMRVWLPEKSGEYTTKS
ncbi:hypothetical protein HID58_095667, partial [Brassica napus]